MEPIPDQELVEKELWNLTQQQAKKQREELKARGFKLARQCWGWYQHWKVEAWDMEDPMRGRYCVIDEAYRPLTPQARTWMRKAKQQDEQGPLAT